jgi:hypothetical protein
LKMYATPMSPPCCTTGGIVKKVIFCKVKVIKMGSYIFLIEIFNVSPRVNYMSISMLALQATHVYLNQVTKYCIQLLLQGNTRLVPQSN